MLNCFGSWFSKNNQIPVKYQTLDEEQRNEDFVQPISWNCYLKLLLFTITLSILILLNWQNANIMKLNTLLNVTKTPVTSNKSTLNLKYILLWTSNSTTPIRNWKSGQQAFIETKCPIINCYVSSRRDLLWGDVTKFDAVVFNGRDLKNTTLSQLPQKRSPHQKYIFLNMESSDNQPICSKIFDGFFNWTATYKLDSDIEYSYIKIRDAAGKAIGPRANMTWINPMTPFNNSLLNTFENKSLAAAWFVSHCYTRCNRLGYAKKLKEALTKWNLTLDIYGKCGTLQCARVKEFECDEILRKKYYFYLSFENSFAEDYVTEKVITALHNNAVPIVIGGAQYSRFLPPGSYLDATLYQPEELAPVMAFIISSPAAYHDFFRWRNHYSYHYPDNLCRLCNTLHDPTKFEAHSVYKEFRGWWNPNFVSRCKDTKWGS